MSCTMNSTAMHIFEYFRSVNKAVFFSVHQSYFLEDEFVRTMTVNLAIGSCKSMLHIFF